MIWRPRPPEDSFGTGMILRHTANETLKQAGLPKAF